jgi:hypothetical protein
MFSVGVFGGDDLFCVARKLFWMKNNGIMTQEKNDFEL